MNFECHFKGRKKIFFAHKPMGLFPKKIFCSLNKPMGLFPSKDGTILTVWVRFDIKKLNANLS
jgi:hypothetical protein